MTIEEIMHAAQRLSVADQIHLVSQLIQLVEQAIQSETLTSLQQLPSPQNGVGINLDIPSKPLTAPHSLKGKVTRYDAFYKPVALEDWDVLA